MRGLESFREERLIFPSLHHLIEFRPGFIKMFLIEEHFRCGKRDDLGTVQHTLVADRHAGCGCVCPGMAWGAGGETGGPQSGSGSHLAQIADIRGALKDNIAIHGRVIL